MSNHSELTDLRSEDIHCKNKYTKKIQKITLMPQIKEAFVGSNVNTISTVQYPFEFCSDLSFIGKLFSRNWHLLFMLSLLISDLTLCSCCSTWYFEDLFSYHEWKQLFTQKSATNYQTYLGNQLKYFWTWNNSMLKLFPETVFSSDHNNNLEWAILET
jgi:hypothetical protein